ncbi:MAG TPA: sugar ABC transporter permease [Candidatus Acidoferrum sp.]|nr:sugar ABC transporter permease [Candidatus Acidoferrum sp.]
MAHIGLSVTAMVQKRRGLWDETGLAMACLTPCLLVLGFVILYPLARGIYLSLLHYRLTDPTGPTLAYLGNYAAILTDSIFWEALRNTVVFSAASVVLGFLAGLVLAVLLDQDLPVVRVLRGLSLMPWIVPYIVVAFLFLYMFNFDVGVINFLLRVLGVTTENVAWLSDPQSAMIAVITANVWNQTPFYILMFLAGLQTIPVELKEAASIDGASPLQVFWHITVPHLQNIMVIATILMVIRNFNNFPLIWVMTQGGPINSTTTLVIYIFRLAFSDFNFGYAAAVGVLWLVLLMVITAWYVRKFEREMAL